MRGEHIAMTVEGFHLLPRRPGWKHEYYGGQAHLTPREMLVTVSLQLRPRPVEAPCPLRPVSAADAPALIELLEEAFTETAEYCDWPVSKIRESARECVEGFFTGRRGRQPHGASQVAEDRGSIIGSALVSATADGPLLDTLFVRPSCQRRGLGTALVAAAVNELCAAGEAKLWSRHHLANAASAAWHRRFGFVEEPDLMLARLRMHDARNELRRRETLGDLTEGERALLQAECERREQEVAALDEIQEREGYEAVSPVLRHRW